MADVKNPAKVPVSQAAPKTDPPKTDTAQVPAQTGKPKKVPLQSIYPTSEAAVTEAKSRTKGPRRAFRTELNGQELFVVANNEGRAGGVAFMKAGGKVDELGRAPRAPKALGVDGVLMAIQSLPKDQQDAVMAQLKALAAKS